MEHDAELIAAQKQTWHSTFKSYSLGFLFSVILTLAAYFAVVERLLTGKALVFTIVALGLVQAAVQLLLFIHLDKESQPRWNLVVFLFMFLVLLILVIGSLWIIYNLNERTMPWMMSPQEMDAYMLREAGMHK